MTTPAPTRPRWEVADIIRAHGDEFPATAWAENPDRAEGDQTKRMYLNVRPIAQRVHAATTVTGRAFRV